MTSLYPFRFQPVYKDYLWGGQRIAQQFQRDVQPGIRAESWELADRPDGMSVIANGALTGMTLHELMKQHGRDVLGEQALRDTFPVLIKIIDAREALSIQVHPDDEAAAQFGGEPKTEMWYVLDATPDAQVYCGLRPGSDEPAFRHAVADGTVGDLLVQIPVRHGDAVFVPGGRVHAIGAGCLLFEVQQNSNTTYRIFDWNRTGPNDKPRDLHLEEALKVIRWSDTGAAKIKSRKSTSGKNAKWEILKTPYFQLDRLALKEHMSGLESGICQYLFVVSGRVVLSSGDFTEEASPGTGYLIPASSPPISLTPAGGPAEILRVTIPES